MLCTIWTVLTWKLAALLKAVKGVMLLGALQNVFDVARPIILSACNNLKCLHACGWTQDKNARSLCNTGKNMVRDHPYAAVLRQYKSSQVHNTF